MRVCYISNQAISAAGWGRYTVEVASGARSYGIEPVLVTAHPDVDASLKDVEHHPILPPPLAGRFSTPRSLLALPQLRRILKGCDAVHCIVELYAPLVGYARPLDKPYILSVFGTWAIRPLESTLQHPVYERAFKKPDRILAISGFTRDWMQRLVSDLPPIEVLPGGVHPERFQKPVSVDFPAWVDGAQLMLSVGAVKPRRGIHVGIEALAIARQTLPNLHYAIAGNYQEMPGYTEKLRQRIVELDLADHVHFLGQLPPYGALAGWYQRADVFLGASVNQGSSFEGLGFVFLEAAAAGTPAIGTTNCGAMEAVIDGQTGLHVPQEDPQATAAALVKVLTDDALRARMRANAPAHAERLSWGNLVKRVVAVYQEAGR